MSIVSEGLPRLVVPKRHVDDRGWFSETFHEQRLRDIGITCRFVQDNQSSSTRAGTLRGFHFQLPPVAQAKLVSVLRGRILDVALDVRSDSPTFGKYVSIELSAELSAPALRSGGLCTRLRFPGGRRPGDVQGLRLLCACA